MANMISKIKAPLKEKFENLLREDSEGENILDVNFAKGYHENGIGWRSYSMIQYSVAWSQFIAIVNEAMINQKIDQNGTWTRKHNKALLSNIDKLVSGITIKAIHERGDNRFRTWAD